MSALERTTLIMPNMLHANFMPTMEPSKMNQGGQDRDSHKLVRATMNPLIWLAISFITLFIVFWRHVRLALAQRRRFVELIDRIPGPKALPLLGNALNFSPDSEKSTYQMEYYFRKYTEDADSPGIMRIWLGPKPIVIIYKSETAKVVLESQVLISKPGEYGILENWLGTGLLTSTGEKWHTRRKMLTPSFHFSVLVNFVHIFNRQASVLVENLDQHCVDGYPFDFYKVIKALALDVICEAAMGVNIEAQRGKNHHYVAAVRKMCELSFLRMRSPWLWPQFAWYLSGKGVEYDRSLAQVRTFTQNVIAERKREFLEADERRRQRTTASLKPTEAGEESTSEFSDSGTPGSSTQPSHRKTDSETTEDRKKLAFLDRLIRIQHDERRLSDEDIREEVDTFMFEGHDTVSSSMGFFVFSLAQRPHLQERLYEEMREIFGDDEDRDVTNEDIAQMKYLEQCIREVMRLLPTVPIIGRVITEDTQIGDFLIPKDTTAMIAPFAVQRDRRYYHNPDSFDPEHFTTERIRKRNPFAYIPFSAGPRNCIGQKFAFTEQKIVLAKIFRRYRFIAHQHELESRGLPELILKPSHGFVIRVERRRPPQP